MMKPTQAEQSSPTSSPSSSAHSQPAFCGHTRPAAGRLWFPRWPGVLAVALLTLVGLSTQAQTYLIDFGGANTTSRGPLPDDPVNYWNNVGLTVGTSATGVLSNLVSSVNSTSNMRLATVSPFNGANENGTQGSSLYPINATRDSLYGNTEEWNGLTNIFPSFKLAGLDAATTYSLTFYASRTGVSDNRETVYTVNGGNSGTATLNASNNADETVSVTNITPNAQGEIAISLAPSANNDNTYHFTYLGFLRVDAVPPQTPIAFTRQPASQQVIQLKPATFAAAVTGAPPYAVQWYENGQPLYGENQFTLTIPTVTLDMNGWYYSVTVSNLAYGVSSTNAVLTVLSDTNPPIALQAVSYDGVTIAMTYNELMDVTTATDYQNYVVNGGAVQVLYGLMNPDNKSVVLTLSAAITGSFDVVVNNVQDLAGNPIAPNTSLSGQVIALEDQDLLFDFGGSFTTGLGEAPNDPQNYWNNVTTGIGTSDVGEMFNLVTVHNSITPIGLKVIRRFNGANENGTQVSSAYAANATRDSLFGNTGTFGAGSNFFPSFKLTGLDTARQYSFTFYASRTSVSDNRETGYTVEGANTNFTALNPANNINNTARVQGMIPNASGEISISIAPTVNNNNGATRFTYLGVLRMSPYAPPLQFLPPVLQNGKIRLEWTGTGKLMRAPSATGTWTEILPTPTSPYEDNVVPGENRFYRLQQ